MQSKLTAELQQWLRAQPGLAATDCVDLSKQRINVVSAATGVASLQAYAQPVLRLLVAITGLVLLIACANVANLLLARGIAARSETAVRVALGARRLRLIRQMLTESLLLSVLGGAAALGVAFLGTRSILLIAFRGARYVPIDPAPSLPVLALAFLLSLLTAVAFGVVPAWIVSRSDPADALRSVGRSTVTGSALVRRSLVVVQIALSVVLLFGAGLLVRTLHNLEDQHLGFETRNRVIIRVDPASAGYKLGGLPALYRELDRRLPQIPGVMSASYSLYSPMGGNNWADNIFVEGRTREKDNASFDRVGPRYFETIGTRLVRGRLISEQDSPNSRPVAVVNQTFARKFFPNDDPIGKHFGMGDAAHSGDFEIIGVVEDAKYQDARRSAYPTFFVPFLQLAEGSTVLGIPVALAGGRLLGSQLYGVGSYDAVVLGLTAGTLAACALVAAFLPARRATAIDPMQALRTE